MKARCRLAILFAGTVLVPTSAAAQGGNPDNAIVGTIVDSITGKPLKDAVIYFTTRQADNRSDRNGRFSITRSSVLDTAVVVRAIGFVPRYVPVPASSGSATDLGSIVLAPVATKLDVIAVEVEEVRLYPQAEEFYQRKQSGVPGQFITREEIEKAGTRQTSDLLGRSGKIVMSCPQNAVRAGNENCTAGNRRGMTGGYRVLSGATSACEMELFVDGRLSTLAVDEVRVDEIAAVEIYSGPATTPARFGARRCGVIAIWTTAGKR